MDAKDNSNKDCGNSPPETESETDSGNEKKSDSSKKEQNKKIKFPWLVPGAWSLGVIVLIGIVVLVVSSVIVPSIMTGSWTNENGSSILEANNNTPILSVECTITEKPSVITLIAENTPIIIIADTAFIIEKHVNQNETNSPSVSIFASKAEAAAADIPTTAKHDFDSPLENAKGFILMTEVDTAVSAPMPDMDTNMMERLENEETTLTVIPDDGDTPLMAKPDDGGTTSTITPDVDSPTIETTFPSSTALATLYTPPFEVALTTLISSNIIRHERKVEELTTSTIPTTSLATLVTPVLSSPAPALFQPTVFPVFYRQNSWPSRSLFTVQKVAGRYSYDFYSETITYAKSVEVCRAQGSRLLTIDSSLEKRSIDAYVHAYQADIFGYRESNNWFLWTGGYFDLQSDEPYILHWQDQLEIKDVPIYHNFCPESNHIHQVIDQILLEKRMRTQASSNLMPCNNRHLAHVIADYRGSRISHSCWQIFDPEMLSPDELKLPFVCKH